MRVGLHGYCVPTGLGYENRRMWRRLPFRRWLVAPHRDSRGLGLEGLADQPRQENIIVDDGTAATVLRFLQDLDVVVCVERPIHQDVFRFAADQGIRCVLLINAEWFDPRASYTKVPTRLVARNEFTLNWLSQAGFKGHAAPKLLFHPLDLNELSFRQRHVASTFLYADGWGGIHERKGLPEIKQANLQGAGIRIRSQRHISLGPGEGESLPATAAPTDLYNDVDVAVQPSRFGGLELSVLEPLAQGLPVITTDAPPMNEYVRAAFGPEADRFLVPVQHVEAVYTNQPWTAYVADAGEIAARVEALRGADIGALSRHARDYVEEVHGDTAWRNLWDTITWR